MLINNIITLIIIFFHILFSFTFLLFSTFSNNINLLLCILIFIIFIKYAFYRFGFCIITPLEENNTFNTTITNLGSLIVKKFNDRQIEEMSINSFLLFIIFKLFILMICNYYKIDISNILKKSIEKVF